MLMPCRSFESLKPFAVFFRILREVGGVETIACVAEPKQLYHLDGKKAFLWLLGVIIRFRNGYGFSVIIPLSEYYPQDIPELVQIEEINMDWFGIRDNIKKYIEANKELFAKRPILELLPIKFEGWDITSYKPDYSIEGWESEERFILNDPDEIESLKKEIKKVVELQPED